jgi:protein transport protein SEC61 subunit alpha
MKARYPIKLLYTSNIPVILAQALFANILFFGQIIFTNFNSSGTNPFLNLIGTFHQDPNSSRMIADFGLSRYVTPPQGLFALFGPDAAPDALLHVAIYALLMILLCWGFSKIWVDISGIAPRDVSRQLLDSLCQASGEVKRS